MLMTSIISIVISAVNTRIVTLKNFQKIVHKVSPSNAEMTRLFERL
jgi:hypothetical protein